eukprot:jgi/Mesvir1/1992/Mv17952-RA.1
MSFAPNPLSLCVSDNTLLAWALEEEPRERRPPRQRQDAASEAQPQSAYARAGGRPPVPWKQLLRPDGGSVRMSYSIPRSVTEASFRSRTNVAMYCGNYIRVGVAIFILNLYRSPSAALGLLGCTLLWDWVRQLEADNPSTRSAQWRHAAASIATWALMILTKAGRALFVSVLLSILLCYGHALLRRITPPPIVHGASHR